MSSHAGTDVHSGSHTGFAPGPWVGASATGLAAPFALFGLVGEGMEAIGAKHDSVAWGLPTLAAMVIGGSLFAYLRRRVLGTPRSKVRWQTLVIGVAVTAGFVAGWIPPVDFLVGIWAGGASASILQLPDMRGRVGRPPRLILVSVAGWLVAGLAAVAAAILVADVILTGALGLDAFVDGTGGFVTILTLIGLVGGAVGATIEAVAVRRSYGGPDTTS
jgi:hypothetical protein